jgi:tetratricopeptide (TPR) repeat protein
MLRVAIHVGDLITSGSAKHIASLVVEIVSMMQSAAARCGRRVLKSIGVIAIASAVFTGCSSGTSLERLTEAKRLSADLFIQFTQASDAANLAVMADTDEASVAFAKQAEDTKRQVQADSDALRPLLHDLNYADEMRLLDEFVKAFTAYRDLDRRILDLAVENTNLKAQRLSFGESQQAADAFVQALNAIVPAVPPADRWRVRALVAGAVADLRAIQVAQAPHIAEADDVVMTRIEQQMKRSETAVQTAIDALRPLTPSSTQPQLAEARAAFDRFMSLNAQIIDLSRRNTNVRSLKLTLNEKGKAASACEQSLRALQDRLSKRALGGSR